MRFIVALMVVGVFFAIANHEHVSSAAFIGLVGAPMAVGLVGMWLTRPRGPAT